MNTHPKAFWIQQTARTNYRKYCQLTDTYLWLNADFDDAASDGEDVADDE